MCIRDSHEATIVKREDRGAIVQLPYGLEAFAPFKHIKKEDGSNAGVDEKLTVKVIEFNRDDKRIIVSHLRYLEDINREAEGEVKAEKIRQKKETRSAITKQNSKKEATTLGDLGVFSQLQGAFQDSNPSTPEPAKAEPAEPVAEEVKPEAVEPVVEKEPEPVAEDVKPEPVVEAAPAATPASPAKEDDLRKIEGIGPKISELLNLSEIITFKQLADTPVDELKSILEDAGPRYRVHNPSTWPQQAQLAADGKWDELQKLQDELDGGKKA